MTRHERVEPGERCEVCDAPQAVAVVNGLRVCAKHDEPTRDEYTDTEEDILAEAVRESEPE